MDDSYKTVNSVGEGLYKEKGSKFISFAYHVESVDEIKSVIDEFKKRYYDARHICYAYVLGPDACEYRANDDREPSGTAGRPILGQIRSLGLTNVLVIVVRYFGGVLLGTSGLIVAYKEASHSALAAASVVVKTVDVLLLFRFDFPFLNEVMRIVKNSGAKIEKQTYLENCEMILKIRKSHMDSLRNELTKVRTLVFIE